MSRSAEADCYNDGVDCHLMNALPLELLTDGKSDML